MAYWRTVGEFWCVVGELVGGCRATAADVGRGVKALTPLEASAIMKGWFLETPGMTAAMWSDDKVMLQWMAESNHLLEDKAELECSAWLKLAPITMFNSLSICRRPLMYLKVSAKSRTNNDFRHSYRIFRNSN